jgi:hypothetical protein
MVSSLAAWLLSVPLCRKELLLDLVFPSVGRRTGLTSDLLPEVSDRMHKKQ